MIGDKLKINDYHLAAKDLVISYFDQHPLDTPIGISVAGESGCGKSELAVCIHEAFTARGLNCLILGQDDYFHLPPHSSHRQRMADISWVGPQEVRLELMNYHVKQLKGPEPREVVKPLVFFEEDLIRTESIKGPFDVIIAEGTYTSLLDTVDIRVFIDRDYHETKKDRLARNRDQALDNGKDRELTFLEKVLEIEHQIIRQHKIKADVVIPSPEVLLG